MDVRVVLIIQEREEMDVDQLAGIDVVHNFMLNKLTHLHRCCFFCSRRSG